MNGLLVAVRLCMCNASSRNVLAGISVCTCFGRSPSLWFVRQYQARCLVAPVRNASRHQCRCVRSYIDRIVAPMRHCQGTPDRALADVGSFRSSSPRALASPARIPRARLPVRSLCPYSTRVALRASGGLFGVGIRVSRYTEGSASVRGSCVSLLMVLL